MIQLRCDSVIVVTVNNIFLEKVLQQIIDIVAFELKLSAQAKLSISTGYYRAAGGVRAGWG